MLTIHDSPPAKKPLSLSGKKCRIV